METIPKLLLSNCVFIPVSYDRTGICPEGIG
jgi:hypothetical protein